MTTYRAASQNVGSNNGTVTVAFPPGTQAGWVALFLANSNGTGSTIAANRGTLLAGGAMGSGASSLWARELVAADITAGSVVFTSDQATNRLSGAVLTFSEADVPTVAMVTRALESASQTTHTTPNLTTTVGGRIVSMVADKSSITTAWTVPAGETKRVEAYSNVNGGTSLVASDPGADQVAGVYGGKAFISTVASVNAAMYTILVPTKAAASTPPPAAAYAANRVYLDAYPVKATGRTPTWTILTNAATGGQVSLDVTDPWRPFFYRPRRFGQRLVFRLRVTDDTSALFTEVDVEVPADRGIEVLTAGTDGVFR